MKKSTTWLIPTLFIVWMFFVLASFYAVQKPFDAVTAVAIGSVLLNLAVAVWLALVALGLGAWLPARLPGVTLSLGEQLVFGTSLGLGAIGLLTLLLGLVGLFNSVSAYAVTLLLTVAAAPQLLKILRQISKWRPAPDSLPNRPTAIYLSIIAFFALLVALLPPADWDGLFYHLTGPKLYLQAGHIFSGFDVPHFNFPSLMEMLFAWAMLLRGDIAAKLLHALFALLLAGLIYLTARRFLGQKSAWPSLLVFSTMPLIIILAGWAYNDLALAFYQLAATYFVISGLGAMGRDQEAANNNSELIISGVFAGLAMGLKYTSFVTPLIIVLIITFYVLRFTNFNFVTLFKTLLTFALPALLVAVPWYIKNWAFTGNPVYPFLYGVFGGLHWSDFRAEWYASAGTGIGARLDTLLALPWLLTLGFRDMNFWDGRTGPLLLLFLPFIIWAGVARKFAGRVVPSAIKILLIYALAHYLFWTLGVIWSRSLWQSRLLLPGLVALVPVAGWVWVNLSGFDTPRFSLSRFVNIAVVLVLVLTLVDIGILTLRFDPLPYLFGLESRDEHLTRRLGAHYQAMQQINTQLPEDATVLFLWEPRSYYCRGDCRPDSILDEFPHAVDQYGSAEAIAQAWRDKGVTHILLHRTGLDFIRSESPKKINQAVLAELEENYWQPLFDVAGAYQVYKLSEQ